MSVLSSWILVGSNQVKMALKQYLENRFKCVLVTCVASALLAALGAPSGGGGG